VKVRRQLEGKKSTRLRSQVPATSVENLGTGPTNVGASPRTLEAMTLWHLPQALFKPPMRQCGMLMHGGASEHMTSNRNWFKTFKPIAVGS
jgi:hypothetical protein